MNGAPFPTIGIEVDDIDELAAAIVESGADYEGDGTPVEDEEGNLPLLRPQWQYARGASAPCASR